MCEACESGEFAEQKGIGPALARRARRIEAALPGDPVPEQSWRILLGQEGGAVPWPETARMMRCLEEATSSLCARLRCDLLPG
jgi:hypothetical protein